jgi:hypothetical protein
MDSRGDLLASSPDGPATAHLDRSVFDGLCRAGLTPAEAGRLAARIAGLRAPARSAWSFEEIQRIVFLRWLVGTGRIRP